MIKVKNGDLDMLGLLFERYHRMLFTFFYRIHRSSETSEDLVQNVFMRILKYRSGFNGEGTFKVWMFHIARNVSNDHFRKEKKLGIMEEFGLSNSRITDHEEHEITEENEQKLMLLRKSLELLEPEKRQLIAMSKLESMKYKDIAEFYGVTEGNIKVRVFRALKDLRDKYKLVLQKEN